MDDLSSIEAREANIASLSFLPSKSKKRYEQTYHTFKTWCEKQSIVIIDEQALLDYFSDRMKHLKSPSSLWCEYSMLKTTISLNNNIDISKFLRLRLFLKRKNAGHTPKKSNVFTKQDIHNFLTYASDDTFLLMKVIMVLGIAGSCRTAELVNMQLHDIDDKVDFVLIKIPDRETKQMRSIILTNCEERDAIYLQIFRRYLSLRKKQNISMSSRFFLRYTNGKFINQPLGKNSFVGIPSKIAKFLKLDDPESYTGHSFRRTSATLGKFRWYYDLEMVLLNIWEIRCADLQNQGQNSQVYCEMAAELTMICAKDINRFRLHSLDWTEVKTKISDFTQKYRSEQQLMNQSGLKSEWRFFDKIHSFLGPAPTYNDSSMLQDDFENINQIKEENIEDCSNPLEVNDTFVKMEECLVTRPENFFIEHESINIETENEIQEKNPFDNTMQQNATKRKTIESPLDFPASSSTYSSPISTLACNEAASSTKKRKQLERKAVLDNNIEKELLREIKRSNHLAALEIKENKRMRESQLKCLAAMEATAVAMLKCIKLKIDGKE